MSDADSVDTVDAIAADFAEAVRRGERPRASEVLARHPEHAAALADLLPTIAGLELMRREATPRRPLERLGGYRILREIGRGGMGVVYEAEEAGLDRRVAVKVLSGEISGDERSLVRFQREARLAARLVHPNVVPVHAFGDEGGIRYFAMHLVDGIGLDRVIDAAAVGLVPAGTGDPLVGLVREQLAGERSARGDRTLHRTTAWRTGACLAIAQAAEALAFAHVQGVLHRDIKPPNLILDRSGHLWVGDFGLAKGHDDEPITVTGNISGTLRYIAPEVFDGRQDGRSDLYSLGLTLFELLSLRPAFNGATRSELIKAVIAGQVDLRQLRQADPDIPPAIERIVATACARRPEQRYRDGAAMARDLRAAATGQPDVVLVRMAEPAPVETSRRPLLLAALAGGVVVLAVALLLRPPPPPPALQLPVVPPPMAPIQPMDDVVADHLVQDPQDLQAPLIPQEGPMPEVAREPEPQSTPIEQPPVEAVRETPRLPDRQPDPFVRPRSDLPADVPPRRDQRPPPGGLRGPPRPGPGPHPPAP